MCNGEHRCCIASKRRIQERKRKRKAHNTRPTYLDSLLQLTTSESTKTHNRKPNNTTKDIRKSSDRQSSSPNQFQRRMVGVFYSSYLCVEAHILFIRTSLLPSNVGWSTAFASSPSPRSRKPSNASLAIAGTSSCERRKDWMP